MESRIKQDFSLQSMLISNVSRWLQPSQILLNSTAECQPETNGAAYIWCFGPLRPPPQSVTFQHPGCQLENLKRGCYDSNNIMTKSETKQRSVQEMPLKGGDGPTRRRISRPTLLIFSWTGKIHLNLAELKLDVDISNILSSQLTLCMFAPRAPVQVGHWTVWVINWEIKKVTRHWDVYIWIYIPH